MATKSKNKTGRVARGRSKSFKFKPWMVVALVALVALVGVLILRFSKASGAFDPGGTLTTVTTKVSAGTNGYGNGLEQTFRYNDSYYKGYTAERLYNGKTKDGLYKYSYSCAITDELVKNSLVTPDTGKRFVCLKPNTAKLIPNTGQQTTSTIGSISIVKFTDSSTTYTTTNIEIPERSAGTCSTKDCQYKPQVKLLSQVGILNGVVRQYQFTCHNGDNIYSSNATPDNPNTLFCQSAYSPKPPNASSPSQSQSQPVLSYSGSVDGVQQTTNSCSVIGWAKDASNVNSTAKVDLYVDSSAGGTPSYSVGNVKADVNRSDVGPHGFVIPLPKSLRDGKDHKVWVYGIDTDADGGNMELHNSGRTIKCAPAEAVEGNFDGVNNAVSCTIGGWAYDTSNTAASVQVQVNVSEGGKLVDSFKLKADKSSKDVNDITGVSGNHRFSAQMPDNLQNGKVYEVSVHGLDSDGKGGNSLLANSPQKVKCNAPTLTPTGKVDGISRDQDCTIKGWAIDRNEPAAGVPVWVFIDNTKQAPVKGVANKTTGDVALVSGQKVGNHKFAIPLKDSAMSDGQEHYVVVRALTSTGNPENDTNLFRGKLHCENNAFLALFGDKSLSYQVNGDHPTHLYWAVYNPSASSSAEESFDCQTEAALFGIKVGLNGYCEVNSDKGLVLNSTRYDDITGQVAICLRAINSNDSDINVAIQQTDGTVLEKTAQFSNNPDTFISGRRTVACVDHNAPFDISQIQQITVTANSPTKVFAFRLKPIAQADQQQ